MKIVIPGGSGQVGSIIARAFAADGHEVVILSRSPQSVEWRTVQWNARDLGAWTSEIDDADVVINLAGRSVNCRYNEANRKAIMDSRVESTRAVGRAIDAAKNPPRVWLQASTATIYAHRYDAPNDDIDGIIGGSEYDTPTKWRFSVAVARAWEKAVDEFDLPKTRVTKLRSSMIMSADQGGIFDTMRALVKRGLGGSAGDGRQYVSWIHERDFVRAIYWIILEGLQDAVNVASPNPLPYRDFMKALREACGMRFGLPTTRLMLEVGAFFMRTETELVLKSRRVVPARLLDSGFTFDIPEWPAAARNLCASGGSSPKSAT